MCVDQNEVWASVITDMSVYVFWCGLEGSVGVNMGKHWLRCHWLSGRGRE